MKLFKKFMRFVKRCAFALGFLFISGHCLHSALLSHEARALTVQEASVKTFAEPRNVFEAIGQQIEGDKEAIARYKRNHEQAVMHRAYELEQRQQELETMDEQGFGLKGNLVSDAVTTGRYKMRQLYLKNDWSLGSLVTDEEMMRISEIRDKIIEGETLTDEEKAFYATMNGSRNEYRKAKETTQAFNTDYSTAAEYASVEAFDNGAPKPKIGIKGNQTVYIFEDQSDVINGLEAYMANILESPDRYAVRIKNQRDKLTKHYTLDGHIIDMFNERGLAVLAAPSSFSETTLTFRRGGVLNNKISMLISPDNGNDILDYMTPNKRDEIQIREMEKAKQQQKAEEINALRKKTGFLENIKNNFKK